MKAHIVLGHLSTHVHSYNHDRDRDTEASRHLKDLPGGGLLRLPHPP